MKVLLFTLPQHGHVNPTLPITQELVARGHEVIYYLTDEFRQKIIESGGIYRPLNESIDIYEDIARIHKQHPEQKGVTIAEAMTVYVHLMANVMGQVSTIWHRAREEQADIIVYDPMCLWGRTIAELIDLPKSTFYTTYVMTKEDTLAQQMTSYMNINQGLAMLQHLMHLTFNVLKLSARYRLPLHRPIDLFTATESLNIVTIPRFLQPNADRFDEQFLFLGQSIRYVHQPNDFPLMQLDDERVIYISLGSTPLNNHPDFFNVCFEAFAKMNRRVVVATGETDPTSLGQAPSNFILRSYVPQIEILQYADVFITHGGMNSTLESLWYGVPLIVCACQPETAMTDTVSLN